MYTEDEEVTESSRQWLTAGKTAHGEVAKFVDAILTESIGRQIGGRFNAANVLLPAVLLANLKLKI